MLNKLRHDQQRYAGAFNPMKRYPRQNQQPEDPAQQMLEQFTGIQMPHKSPTPPPDPNYNDW